MKITFFIGRLAAGGGAEKVLTMLANHYSEKGWGVDIVLLLGSEVDSSHFKLQHNINIIDLSEGGSYWSNAFKWIRKIRNQIKKTQPDVIISFIGRINALVLTSLFGVKIPIIVSERNDPKNDRRGKLLYAYCKWVYRFASILVFQTKYQQNCFPPQYANKSIVIPNPIEILPKDENIKEEHLVVTAGRLNSQKNHHLLIDSIGMVKKEIPDVRCKIYGEGKLRKELQDKINSYDLSKTITLEGKKSTVTSYISKGTVFVMTSNREGLSNALMEAMMLGMVCISTDYPGVEDIIEDGITGYVIPRGDKKALANKIIYVLNDKDGRNSMISENARAKMIKNESSIVLSKWDEMIKNLL